jgi:hypothetical protein
MFLSNTLIKMCVGYGKEDKEPSKEVFEEGYLNSLSIIIGLQLLALSVVATVVQRFG